MRKITRESVSAFRRGENFYKQNMIVVDGKMKLFGNTIAKHDDEGNIWITDAGWATNTTVDRLRGLGARVHRKGEQMFLNGEEWSGEWIKLEE